MHLHLPSAHYACTFTVSNSLQAEVITTLLTFAEACAHPNAKRLMFHGLTGPVNAVEVDGTFFIESDEAEAKAACSKTPELASEAAVAPKAAENSAARAVRVAAWVGGDEGVVEAEVVADLEGVACRSVRSFWASMVH